MVLLKDTIDILLPIFTLIIGNGVFIIRERFQPDSVYVRAFINLQLRVFSEEKLIPIAGFKSGEFQVYHGFQFVLVLLFEKL